MIESLKQTELDLFEQQILTDLFGGVSSEHMTVGSGIFKVNISGQVQKYIDKFENLVRPLMDEQGKIEGSTLKQYLSGNLAAIVPDGKFRLIEVYRQAAPLIRKIAGGMK